MLELDERFNSHGTELIGAGSLTLNSNAFNHLYGYQVGADVELTIIGGPLQINAVCKAGIFENYTSDNISRIDAGSVDPLGTTRNKTAFLGEAGLVGTYALTKHLAFRSTIQAAWLEGVALAPEQIVATNFRTGRTAVNTSGGVFYYGGGVGLEYRVPKFKNRIPMIADFP